MATRQSATRVLGTEPSAAPRVAVVAPRRRDGYEDRDMDDKRVAVEIEARAENAPYELATDQLEQVSGGNHRGEKWIEIQGWDWEITAK